MVGGQVGVCERGCDFVLAGRNLVVSRLDGDAQAIQPLLRIEHAGENPGRYPPEIMVVQFLALRGLGTEKGAAADNQVRTLVVEALVDKEVLLLGAHRGKHFGGRIAKEFQDPPRLFVQRVDGPASSGVL